MMVDDPYVNPMSVPATWAPSTWQPGQTATARNVDTSTFPWPTPAQIEAQRQLINQHLKQYGYQPQQLSDSQVLSTMSNLPQRPVVRPDWVEDYLRRNPNEQSGARPGVDLPFNQTYEVSNLKTPALNTARPTTIGYALGTPRGAILEHFGQAALDEYDRQLYELAGGDPANMATSVYGPDGKLISQTNPPGAPQSSGAAGSTPYAAPAATSSGSAPAGRNALDSRTFAAANWMQDMQQKNPSLWQALLRLIGLGQPDASTAASGNGAFFSGGGGPRYTLGGAPAIPQAKTLDYTTE